MCPRARPPRLRRVDSRQQTPTPLLRIEVVMSLGTQVVWLFVMALAVASVAGTVTHEEVFRERREYGAKQGRKPPILPRRRSSYCLPCNSVFGPSVAAFFLRFPGTKFFFKTWRV